MRKRLELSAVWDDDIQELLGSLGVLQDVTLGNARCVVCGRQVDIDNLGAVMPTPQSADFACDDANCVRAVTSQGVVA